jgi:8-oxo-dGTP diphosphatase
MKVAVALITDKQQRLLITQRATNSSHGGFWEFPGGKLESNEAPTIALIREVKEEVGLDVLVCRYLGEIHHQYDTRDVILLTYHVNLFRGNAAPCESQLDLRWVALSELGNYTFPAANDRLLERFIDHVAR